MNKTVKAILCAFCAMPLSGCSTMSPDFIQGLMQNIYDDFAQEDCRKNPQDGNKKCQDGRYKRRDY